MPLPLIIIGIGVGRAAITGFKVVRGIKTAKQIADAKKAADLAKKAAEAKKKADQARKAAEAKRKTEQAKDSGTKVKDQRRRRQEDECDEKKKKGRPVNTVTGCKVLDGSIDTDFALNSASPFVWKRTYSSQSDIGTEKNPYTWFGQGWDCPYAAQIKVLSFQKKIELILPMGHVVEIPYLEEGSKYFCIQDNLTLIREKTAAEYPHSSYRFKIALGKLQSASNFYEFYHQVQSQQ